MEWSKCSWTCGAPRCGPSGDFNGFLTGRENSSSRVCLDITCSYYPAHRLLVVLLLGPSFKETQLFASLLSPLFKIHCWPLLSVHSALRWQLAIQAHKNVGLPPLLTVARSTKKEFQEIWGKSSARVSEMFFSFFCYLSQDLSFRFGQAVSLFCKYKSRVRWRHAHYT